MTCSSQPSSTSGSSSVPCCVHCVEARISEVRERYGIRRIGEIARELAWDDLTNDQKGYYLSRAGREKPPEKPQEPLRRPPVTDMGLRLP